MGEVKTFEERFADVCKQCKTEEGGTIAYGAMLEQLKEFMSDRGWVAMTDHAGWKARG
jgi:hypothetical protein